MSARAAGKLPLTKRHELYNNSAQSSMITVEIRACIESQGCEEGISVLPSDRQQRERKACAHHILGREWERANERARQCKAGVNREYNITCMLNGLMYLLTVTELVEGQATSVDILPACLML